MPTGGKAWDGSKLQSGCGWQEMQMQMHLHFHFHRSGSFILALGQATLFSNQILRTSVQGREVSGPMALLSQLFVCVPYAPTSRALCREKIKEMSYIQMQLVSPESLLGTQLSPDPDLLKHNLPTYQSSERFVGTGH